MPTILGFIGNVLMVLHGVKSLLVTMEKFLDLTIAMVDSLEETQKTRFIHLTLPILEKVERGLRAVKSVKHVEGRIVDSVNGVLICPSMVDPENWAKDVS